MRDAAAFDEALTAAERTPPRPTGRTGVPSARAGVMFVIPAVILYALLLALPIVQTVYYSLTRWNGISSTLIGLGNYERLFTRPDVLAGRAQQRDPARSRSRSPSSSRSLVAFLLNEHVLGWRFFRSVYFLPTAISWVVIGMVAVRFFAQRGMLNGLLRRSAWAIPVQTNMLATRAVARWSRSSSRSSGPSSARTPSSSSPGMATLDRDVYEAARCRWGELASRSSATSPSRS